MDMSDVRQELQTAQESTAAYGQGQKDKIAERRENDRKAAAADRAEKTLGKQAAVADELGEDASVNKAVATEASAGAAATNQNSKQRQDNVSQWMDNVTTGAGNLARNTVGRVTDVAKGVANSAAGKAVTKTANEIGRGMEAAKLKQQKHANWDLYNEKEKRQREAAERMNEEADRVGAIGARDEKGVAGERAEARAKAAGNAAADALGGSAGGGAAGIARMQAAQQARDAAGSQELQNATERKDAMEQKEVERRQDADMERHAATETAKVNNDLQGNQEMINLGQRAAKEEEWAQEDAATAQEEQAEGEAKAEQAAQEPAPEEQPPESAAAEPAAAEPAAETPQEAAAPEEKPKANASKIRQTLYKLLAPNETDPKRQENAIAGWMGKLKAGGLEEQFQNETGLTPQEARSVLNNDQQQSGVDVQTYNEQRRDTGAPAPQGDPGVPAPQGDGPSDVRLKNVGPHTGHIGNAEKEEEISEMELNRALMRGVV
jgi:hypothetical protein